jgi:hypothetical protein
MMVRSGTPSARRVDVFEVAGAQELGAHHADERDPGEQQHDAEQDEEAGRQHGRHDQQQVEHRDRRPDLDEALEEQVGPAAEIALHGAGRDADDRRRERSGSGRTAPRCGSRR